MHVLITPRTLPGRRKKRVTFRRPMEMQHTLSRIERELEEAGLTRPEEQWPRSHYHPNVYVHRMETPRACEGGSPTTVRVFGRRRSRRFATVEGPLHVKAVDGAR